MTADTCKTCHHWQPVDALTEADEEWFADDEGNWYQRWPLAENDRWGSCSLIQMPEYGETATVPAFVQDGSGYRADLHTRADFGCVLHLPRRAARTDQETPNER